MVLVFLRQVRRIASYEQWYSKFKAALEKLDHAKQQQSPLPIIYQWQHPQSGSSGTKYATAAAPLPVNDLPFGVAIFYLMSHSRGFIVARTFKMLFVLQD